MGPVFALTDVAAESMRDVVADSERLGANGTLAEFILTLGVGSPCVCCGTELVRPESQLGATIAVCPKCGAELAIAAGAALPRAA